MQATQNPPHPEGTLPTLPALPHQQSKPILQHLSHHHPSSNDDFYHPQIPTPEAGAKNGPIGAPSQAITAGNTGSQFPERKSGDSSRHGKRVIGPGEEDSGSSDSSHTFEDKETHGLEFQNDTPLAHGSSSTIEDLEQQDQGTKQADRPSDHSSRDLEKGNPGSKEHDKVSQDDEKKNQTQWKNDVVGWDGPNDPQNPMNWTKSKKYYGTALYASLTFCITFASSVFSTATQVTAKGFGVSNEVMALGTSVFVFVSAHFLLRTSSSADTVNRVLRSAQSSGVPSPNSTVERFLSSSDSSSSPSFKSPSL